MKLQSVADQHGVKQIVNGGDEATAPHGQHKGLHPVSVECQKNRRRDPDHEGPEHGNDGQQSHHQTPQHRGWRTEPPEHQPAQRALDAGDHHGAKYRGVDRFGEAADDLVRLQVTEGRNSGQGQQRLPPVPQEVEQQVESQKSVDHLRYGSTQQARALRRRPCREVSHYPGGVQPLLKPGGSLLQFRIACDGFPPIRVAQKLLEVTGPGRYLLRDLVRHKQARHDNCNSCRGHSDERCNGWPWHMGLYPTMHRQQHDAEHQCHGQRGQERTGQIEAEIEAQGRERQDDQRAKLPLGQPPFPHCHCPIPPAMTP